MTIIEEIHVEETERWNTLVHLFPDYEVFYLNEYARAFMQEDTKNGEPVLLYYENGEDRALNVVFKRDISKEEKLAGNIGPNQYFDLISPYGYGGFWGNVKEYAALNQAYEAYCISQGYVCEFVRFTLFGDYREHYSGEVTTRTHNVVRTLKMPLEELWMDVKQKVRKNVKRAKKNGLKLVMENTGTHLNEFLDIYYSTMERSGAEGEFYFSKQFFETLNQMEGNFMYFYALYEEQIVSAELVLYGARNAYSYLGGTRKEFFEVRPNDYLKFEIIKWAHEKGLRNFVLGGGYGADDGIFQYKACLAPKGIVDFYIGRKIFDQEIYDMLTNLRDREGAEKKIGYFPEYRA
ncbi:MAG: GNAT family N-acetyltransferase [Lachnospiraceae bacterium]|nr:GNAT family N-acetyltransferase [Lachnospiraceae bacterium]